jgi:hypothetical protein
MKPTGAVAAGVTVPDLVHARFAEIRDMFAPNPRAPGSWTGRSHNEMKRMR